jgi:hypothetical protein
LLLSPIASIKNKGDDLPVGGIGFFDCINSQDAADMLLDVAKHWLMQKGMQAMDGPINFGERDRWWGLVVQGFQQPLYCMNYNPPFYKELLENYGFENFYNQICFGMDAKAPLSQKCLNGTQNIKTIKIFMLFMQKRIISKNLPPTLR